MDLRVYPKVLIIGNTFNKVNGAGITMSNLFQDWPSEKLALASISNLHVQADFSICSNFYQLGYNGKFHPFPLNILLPKIECGEIKKIDKNGASENSNLSGGKYKKIYQILYHILTFLGLYNYIYNIKITDNFRKWILEFNPDIIYSQLSTLELIRLVDKVHSFTNKPVAIHIMDDWPVAINKPSILYHFWKRKIDSEFRDLISKSQILMSICQGMSDEYMKRYNRLFYPFHNPITVNKWLPYSKTNWEINGVFKILYTGRIGVANGKSIMLIAKVIDKLNLDGLKFSLDIFTPDYQSIQANNISVLNGIKVHKTIENKLMPELLPSYDLLVLPLDFDKRAIHFAKLSMPTKASEYMVSGTPVLVFADSQTFLALHATSEKWAYVVTQNSEKALADSLLILNSDIDLRKQIAKDALSFAIKNEDSYLIKEEFRKCLILQN